VDDPHLSSTPDSLQRPRHKPPTAEPQNRVASFDLIEQTLEETAAIAEAGRCLECHLRQLITPVTLPPEKWRTLSAEEVGQVPETAGVFQLLDEKKAVLCITGTANLRESLLEKLANPGAAVLFIAEEDPMYTKRESELIQQYLQEHGEMPGGAGGDDDLDDLF
jgi:hypothetical protein